MNTPNIVDFFPHDEVRDAQATILDFIQNSTKRIVAVEAPTGVGKSPIAIAFCRWIAACNERRDDSIAPNMNKEVHPGSYVLTPNKILQQQYCDRYDEFLYNLKGRSNYSCHCATNCDEGKNKLGMVDDDKKSEHPCINDCAYTNAKTEFINSMYGTTNFQYFLTERKYVGELGRRSGLVIDEAHCIEQTLMGFVSVDFSKASVFNVLDVSVPDTKNIWNVIAWLDEDYLPAVDVKLAEYDVTLANAKMINDTKLFLKTQQSINALRYKKKSVDDILDEFMHDPKAACKKWVIDQNDERMAMKPLDISKFCNEYLFSCGDKVLIMSATLGAGNPKTFFRNLGLDMDDIDYLQVDCPFPAENRVVYAFDDVSMAKKNAPRCYDYMVDAVNTIINLYDGEKGIIHTHSYQIQDIIRERVKSDRILTHDRTNKDDILQYHMTTSKPTVLVSPSMAEGVDLYDDLSRFQIVCKVPYPYLGDAQVNAKKAQDDLWYAWLTSVTLIQALGRSIRSMEDWAETFIVDASFNTFRGYNRRLFPKWINFNKGSLKELKEALEELNA